MKRKHEDELARGLGYESHAAWRRAVAAPRPGTRLAITHALLDVRHVRTFDLAVHPGTAAAIVRMKWYAWLTFGWLHRRTLKRFRMVMHREVPAAADVAVYFTV